ncbi:MAG TPA: hypothetical protein VFA01_00800 [Candidatus Dormibacteraeota bacterium]|nr:hypothetical protein [Candidatus Dormibacteraeota bacterium]
MAKAQKASGVERMLVDREAWTVTIWYDPAVTDRERLERAIADAAKAVDENEH